MILITSSGEFSFFSFFSILLLVFFSFISMLKKKSRIVSLLSRACLVLAAGVHVPMDFNYDQMEPPHKGKHSQYLVERNPNTYRSIRDYRNPPQMSAPSYIVPPTNAPYDSTYNPSWGNNPNLSWKSRPP